MTTTAVVLVVPFPFVDTKFDFVDKDRVWSLFLTDRVLWRDSDKFFGASCNSKPFLASVSSPRPQKMPYFRSNSRRNFVCKKKAIVTWGHSITTLTQFCPFLTTYLCVDIFYSECGKVYILWTTYPLHQVHLVFLSLRRNNSRVLSNFNENKSMSYGGQYNVPIFWVQNCPALEAWPF